MEKLDNCPFCGGKSKLDTQFKSGNVQLYRAFCTKCPVVTLLTSEDEAISAWNSRVNQLNNNNDVIVIA